MLNSNDICNSRDRQYGRSRYSVCADVGIKFRKQIADQCNFVESPTQSGEPVFQESVFVLLERDSYESRHKHER